MTPAAAVEWGTDHWGEVFSEPTEGHARGVARITGAKLFKRIAGEEWVAEVIPAEAVDATELLRRIDGPMICLIVAFFALLAVLLISIFDKDA